MAFLTHYREAATLALAFLGFASTIASLALSLRNYRNHLKIETAMIGTEQELAKGVESIHDILSLALGTDETTPPQFPNT